MSEALAEAKRRKSADNPRAAVARRSLLGFTRYTYPRYKADPVHELIAATLDRVIAGDIKRLMIFAPPQHGKSELVSVRLPAYWLGRRPDDPVIISSYGADLAYSKSRQAREIVEGTEFAEVFPQVRTKPDSRAVNLWELAAPNRGKLIAAGVGGPITGHGGLLGIIDDPFENWEQAQSPAYRLRAKEWYKGTFRTRIWEHGAIILVMTRWHEDDLAGWLIDDQGSEWEVLRLPAVAETHEERVKNNKYLKVPDRPDPLGRQPGEPLSPNRFSTAALAQLEHDVGSMVWGAEYQGVPRPSEGNKFKRAWFKIVDAVPRGCRRVRYWDKAGTEDAKGAATAGVLMAESPDGMFFVEHVVQGWYSAKDREDIILETAKMDAARYGGPTAVQIFVEQEPGSGGKESAQATIKNLAGYIIQRDLPSGNKDTRLHPFAVQCQGDNVRLLRGDWNQGYIDEMCAIPNGKRRDQGDASAGAFNKLALEDYLDEGDAPEVLENYRGG